MTVFAGDCAAEGQWIQHAGQTHRKIAWQEGWGALIKDGGLGHQQQLGCLQALLALGWDPAQA